MGYYPHFILPMRSSRGFASTAANLVALFGLAFASAPAQTRLNLADDGKSPDHYAKGTPSPGTCVHRAPTACRHVVSGSLSSPCWGSSHRSLALLTSLSVAREYLALRDGPRRFGPTFTCSVLLRCRIEDLPPSPTGLSPCAVTHSRAFGWSSNLLNTGPTTPPGRVRGVWAGPRSLAATDGVAFAFLSSGY